MLLLIKFLKYGCKIFEILEITFGNRENSLQKTEENLRMKFIKNFMNNSIESLLQLLQKVNGRMVTRSNIMGLSKKWYLKLLKILGFLCKEFYIGLWVLNFVMQQQWLLTQSIDIWYETKFSEHSNNLPVLN